MTKTLIAFAAGLSMLAFPAAAQVHVKGYVKKDGTYVAPHVRTKPNNTTLDNYSTYPNVNPYTGRQGTTNPYPTYRAPPPAPTYQPYTPPKAPAYTPYKAPCYYNCK